MFPQTRPESTDERWYVVHCRPGKEFLAESALQENLGLSTYLPIVLSHARGAAKKVPFFPGYLFLSAAPPQLHVTRIRSMPGVVRMLEFGDGPQAVPKLVVSAIMERLETLNARGGLPSHDFKTGETVTMKSGPFRGLQAVFMGPMTPSARVKILLEFLGRLNEVKVDLEDLAHSHGSPVPTMHNGTDARSMSEARGRHDGHNGHRGTRGRGRSIRSAQGR
jgi:transcription antitermination factor NusG